MGPFYSDLQAVNAATRKVAGESHARLRERLTDQRRILALGREFVRSAEMEVQRLELAIAAVGNVSGENGHGEGLRGKRLATRAIEILRSSGTSQPVHYTAWFRLLEDAGEVIAANDPMATFLTSIARDGRVRRVGHRAGLYELEEV